VILELGSQAPGFDLPGVDGKKISLAALADKQALCVVFTCNHCPYAQAYEGRLIALQAKIASRGGQVLAINSNDATGYPEDSFDNMKLRAREKGFNFPYLQDETQAVAKAYGAVRTPHIFLFDAKRELAYVGRIDDCWDDASKVTAHELEDAIEDILSQRPVKVPETFAVGCTIKWKDG
jgi:peroxiredoxin